MSRRVAVLGIAASLAWPSASLADSGTDGTLVIRNGIGTPGVPVMNLRIDGAVVGEIDGGRVVIDDPDASDGPAATVAGATRSRDISGTATVYTGSHMRFRAIGGLFRIRVYGYGVNINAVGLGTMKMTGAPGVLADGQYSINGAPFQSLPDLGRAFTLSGQS
jgi:hypothetical protein